MLTGEHQNKKMSGSVSVEAVKDALSPNDLNDLCDATDSAIEGGGGFGWLKVPERPLLERYWQGVVVAPTRRLFVARLDETICGSTQLILPPINNEAQAHVVHLTTNFVAPWARGYGIARTLLETVESWAVEAGFSVINLDVRETMETAISLYEAMGYQKFGEHPFSVRAHGKTITSRYYYKVVNPSFFL